MWSGPTMDLYYSALGYIDLNIEFRSIESVKETVKIYELCIIGFSIVPGLLIYQRKLSKQVVGEVNGHI